MHILHEKHTNKWLGVLMALCICLFVLMATASCTGGNVSPEVDVAPTVGLVAKPVEVVSKPITKDSQEVDNSILTLTSSEPWWLGFVLVGIILIVLVSVIWTITSKVRNYGKSTSRRYSGC